jgi:hypothetical protein
VDVTAMTNDPNQSLFDLPGSPGVVRCERCGKRCRAAKSEKPEARPFRKAERGTCLECCVAGLFQQPTNGDEALPTALAMAVKNGSKPEDLRLPHLQQQFERLMRVGQSEAEFGQIDWDEVIANWHLPFPPEPARKRGRRT